MEGKRDTLGRLVAVYAIAPAFVQRAAFTAVLSFMFFLAMMFAFYILQSALYFLLSTAFLVIYLLTMFSFVMQRKKHFQVYENGFTYRKQDVLWPEIEKVDLEGTITLKTSKQMIVPKTLHEFDRLMQYLLARVG